MMKTIFSIVCEALGIWLVACSTLSADVDIQLRDRIVSQSPVVRLCDVAEIVTADREEGRRLAGLLLMPAPAPGTERYLRLREVQDLLAAHGEDLSMLRFAQRDQVAIVSPEARPAHAGVVESRGVDRAALLRNGRAERTGTSSGETTLADEETELLREQFRQTIVNYLSAKAGRTGVWRVSCAIADRNLTMLRRATSPPRCEGGSEPWTGQQRFVISFTTADGPVRVPVYAEVSLATQAVIVVRPIARGEIVTAAQVELRTIDYVAQPSDRRTPVDSVEAILGMEARQALREGDAVFLDQVRPPLLVKRGDLISVTSHGGGIRIRVTARALADGARGELVQVESLEMKQTFEARVTGTREAAVFAAARPATPRPKLERTETAWRR